MKVIKVQQQKQGYKVTTEDKKEYSIPYIKGTFFYKETKAFIDGGGVIEDEFSLDDLKTSKLSSINTSCEAAIVGGFTSSALGSVHTYQSDRDDQINLMGLVTAGADDLLKCGVDDGNGNITWDWKQHTATQLKAVFDDGASFKKQQLIKANTLKAQVAAATTVEELDGIVW